MKTPLGTVVDLGVGHIVLDGFPALRERGTAHHPPLLGPCLLWQRSPISATAELLFWVLTITYRQDATTDIRAKYVKRRGSAQGCAFWRLQNHTLTYTPLFPLKPPFWGHI